MNYIRRNKIRKSVCIFFALLIFNTSIDTPDFFRPVGVSEKVNTVNVEINDIETLAELVLENMLNIENAIPEEKIPDNQNHGINHFAKLTFIHQPPINKSLIDTNPLNNKNDISFLHSEPRCTSQFIEVSTPPPKA